MKATKILLVVVILLSVASVSGAVEKESSVPAKLSDQKELGVTFDLTYMSKYMSKGVEAYGQQGGIFAHTIIDFWGSGFGLAVGHQNATSSGYVDSQRFNYKVFYRGVAFEDSPYKTQYGVTWIYKHYYGRARSVGNTEEWILGFSWPELLGVKNLVPFYVFDYEYSKLFFFNQFLSLLHP